MPSHKTQDEAVAAGDPELSWVGNDKAGEAAKAFARSLDAPPQLLIKWADKQRAEESACKLIAESQVRHLAERPRRQDGCELKSRKRKTPQRPCRATRRRTVAAQAEALQVQPPGQAAARGRASPTG